MAGIIKKQILKHLSRFTKNLSPDKINLSTLKGEGQLTNLELDEEVLQNVLELPTWLAITRVYCNRASIRIQWTKLKTHPICLCLDKVEVEMKTCEEPRPPNGQSPIALASGQSEYGFAEKVVEGMFIIVNSITIKIHSKAFHASFELWQLQGYSVNPNWQQSDLRLTRITDPRRGEVLTFKEITWQTLRIEADATDNGDQDPITTPLRLITNQGRIQIALKRRTKDCNVIASKLMFLLDDLLWVLTDSQLKAMMKYAESLSEAMEKSAQQRKSLAPEPVQITPPPPSAQQSWAQAFGGSQGNSSSSSSSSSRLSQYFEKFDVKESSYHLLISRLDLHICDDSQSRDPGISANRLMGGAMQLTFRKMAFDYYPFHWAGDSCKHWVRHCEAMETRGHWAQKLVIEFQSKMEKWHEETGLKPPWHLGVDSPFRRKADSLSSPRKNLLEKCPSGGRQAAFRPPAWNRLRSSCMVVRVDDLDIHQVSTAGQPSKKPSTLLSCSRKLHSLPTQVSAIHVEFTEYYFPDNQELPVPCPNLYIQLNDLAFTVDPVSLLWGNLFCLDLYRSLEQFKAIYKLEDSRQKDEHLDIRLDAFRLKVRFPLEKREQAKLHRPQALVFSSSGMIATNTRYAPQCSCPDLQTLFRGFAAAEFFHSNYDRFPKVPGGFSLLHMLFLHHAFQMDSRLPQPSTLPPQRPKASQDLWSIHFTQISLDFEGTENFKGHTLNFVAPFPLSVWACLPLRWQQAQARRLLLASEGRLKPSASFGSPVHSEALIPDSVSHQRSKTEHDLKSLSGLTEVMEILREGSDGVDNKGPVTELEDAADVHVLVHSPAHVRVRLDHYQYLALLRLKEVLQELQEQLTKDTEVMTGSPLQDQTACIGVLFPSAEVALLMHPAPGAVDADSAGSDTTSLIDSELSRSEDRELKSDASSDQGPASPEKVLENNSIDNLDASHERPQSNGELQDSGPLPQQLAGKGHEAVESLQAKRLSRAQASSSPAALKSTAGRDTAVNGQGEPVPLKNLEGELSSAIHMTKDATKEALHATMDLTKEAVSLTKDAFSLGRDRMTSTMHKMLSLPPTKEPMAKTDEGPAAPVGGGAARLRFFSMKRTVSQQSFDGVSLDNSGPEDRISVDSDGSDSFVMLLESESGPESVPSGSLPGVLDDAVQGSPVVDSFGQRSPGANSSVSPSGEDLVLHSVSVLVLKVNEVSVGIEVRGEDLTVALQAEDLTLQQLGTVGLWQFLQGQCPGTSFQESSSLKTDNIRPAVGLRFEVGPRAAVHSPLAAQNGFLHFLLRGCDLELLTSVLNGLGPFLEDEEVPVVFPMQIELLNSSITLKDDIPPIYPTSPGPVPITVAMEHVVLKRSDDGVFHIGAAAQDRPSAEVPKSEKKQPLKEQLFLVPTGEVFRQQVNELPTLQKELIETKQALASANQDKEKLLQEIRKYNPLFEL
ncbi:bridge-like lipid transfer protein family member 3A isoform X1 [Ictidomys tridecemlineatus]|uniref:UHRF1-binding protein 1 isoform X1 n=3 Tax=Ictidomys tridecemlineatus TaxID=43179 RepID=UPI00038C0BAB|nr:UHRF1-binding protein 1 isoform X1 [Ictidomys tridecemlineatus]KAG3289270.1 UHRF1 binding protein 1, transcript variant X1 [Ictidomys tridecemlineatus]